MIKAHPFKASTKCSNAKSINKMHSEGISFNKLIYPVTFLAQLFALMPLSNASNAGRDIKFKFISLRFAYYVTITVCAFAITCICMAWLFYNRMEFGKVGKIKLELCIPMYDVGR